jgi:hypothetical protein
MKIGTVCCQMLHDENRETNAKNLPMMEENILVACWKILLNTYISTVSTLVRLPGYFRKGKET